VQKGFERIYDGDRKIMQELVSIIVPVYNVEKYINECITSIVNQTYKNLEICLINDGSTDNSGKYCEEWEHNDSRINIIHQYNQGVSAARNRGLEVSTGKWIVFIDSDDYIAHNYIETLLNLNHIYSTRISCCRNQLEDDEEEQSKREKSISFMRSKEYKATVWRYMFDRELFYGISFPVGKTSEDTAVLYKLIYRVDYVAISTKKLYITRIREESLNYRKYKINQCDIDRIDILQEKAEFFEKENQKELADNAWKDYLANILVVYNCKDAEKFSVDRKDLLKKYRKQINKVRKNRAISWKMKLVFLFSNVYPMMWKFFQN